MPGQGIWRWTRRCLAELGPQLARLARLARPAGLAGARRPGWRAAAGVAGAAVLMGGHVIDRRIAAVEAEHRALGERARQWEGPAREAARLRQEIAAVSRHGGALDALLHERSRPAWLLDALARQVPRGVHLRGVSQQGDTVTIDGAARHHERVAALVRELEPSPWLASVDLIESRAAPPGRGAANDGDALVAFSVRLVYRPFATGAIGATPATGAPAPPPRSQQRSPHGDG